jgi:hypothetical protein
MGFLMAIGLTGIVVAMGAGMTVLTGLVMGLGTAMVTAVIGFISLLMLLI